MIPVELTFYKFNNSAYKTSCGIADNVAPRKRCSHKSAKQGIVAHTEYFGVVEILSCFYRTGKEKHPKRQKLDSIGNKNPYKAIQQYYDKHISEISTDKIRKIKLCNQYFTDKQKQKNSEEKQSALYQFHFY